MGNERYGRPSNPAFLLKPGELLEVVRGRLRVVAYEDLEVNIPSPTATAPLPPLPKRDTGADAPITIAPKPAVVQRICAIG